MPRQEAQTGGPDRRPRNHKKGAGKETGRTQEGGKRLKTYAKRYEKTEGGHKNEAEGPEALSTTGGGQHLLRKPVKMTERTQGGGKRPKTYAKRYEKPSGKHKNEVGRPEASSTSGFGENLLK